MSLTIVLLAIAYSHEVTSAQGAASKRELHFSLITAFTGSPTSSGGIPVIDFALEQINNDTRLLPNYNLRYTSILDSKCETTAALEGFLQHFDNASEPTYITSMCCGCSSATIPVAEISHHWSIPHISFASSAPILSNRKRFKTFFHTLPCYVYEPPTVETMMKEFQWKQMAIINQDESPLDSVAEGIQKIFERQGWKLGQAALYKTSGSERVLTEYKELLEWDEDYRIIMINTFEDHVYHILCEAYHKYGQRLLNQEIVILMHGRYMTEWWETAYREVNSSCTRDEVMRALNKTLAFTPETYDLMENSSAKSYAGITAAEFSRKYLNLLKEERYASFTPLNFFGSAYDAIWVVAFGLDLVDKWVKNGTIISDCEKDFPGELVSLHEFEYTNKKMGCYMTRAFHKVNIIGITGPVEFSLDGARPDNVMRLRQNRVKKQGGKYVVTRPTVARVTNNLVHTQAKSVNSELESIVFSPSESYSTIWPDGVVPYDGSSVDVLDYTHLAITITFSILGISGLAFVVVALFFNIIFRKKRIIKLGSPNLNLLVIAGATILYTAMFFTAFSAVAFSQKLEETMLCNFRFWLFSIGNALCFGVILAKQWRIYYIFSNPTPNKKVIKDWILAIVVAVIVAIELVILLIGTAIPESRLTAHTDTKNEMRQNGGVNEKVYIFLCAGSTAEIWLAISFGYKALLQLGAIFMAFTTRKVKVKGLNDTKEIYTIIYINTVIITMLIVTEFALRTHQDAYIALFGLSIFLEASLFLALMFIPKAVLLYKDPEGKKIFVDYGSHPKSHFTIADNSQNTAETLTAPEVQAKIAYFQKQLAQIEKVGNNQTEEKQAP